MRFEDLNAGQVLAGITTLRKKIDQGKYQLHFGDAKEDVYAHEQIDKARIDMEILVKRFVELELKRIHDGSDLL